MARWCYYDSKTHKLKIPEKSNFKKRWFYAGLTPANIVLLCDFLQREELDIRNKASHLHSCISQMVCVFQHMYMARCSMIIRRVCRTNGTTAAAAVQHKSPWAEIISTSLCVWWNLLLGRHRFHISEPTSGFHTRLSRCGCKLVECGLVGQTAAGAPGEEFCIFRLTAG